MEQNNKRKTIKKITIRFAIVFFLALALLTYFSKSIDHFMLPRVYATKINTGPLNDGTDPTESSNQDEILYYDILIPKSSIITDGNSNYVYIAYKTEDSIMQAFKKDIEIIASDELYCAISADGLYHDNSVYVIYETSKNISDGDRVILEEE